MIGPSEYAMIAALCIITFVASAILVLYCVYHIKRKPVPKETQNSETVVVVVENPAGEIMVALKSV